MADIRALASRPLLLEPNLVAYVVPGGGLLPRFLGLPPSAAEGHSPSQLWIASTVSSALGSPAEGLSRLDPSLGGLILKDLLSAEPAAFLGAEHAARWGASPAFLMKALNSRDRLLVQAHPDKTLAKRHFSSDFGKTEAWYVVDAEPGALVYAGFKPGVDREGLRAAILREDSEEILGLLHAFPVRPGDLLFIPAGLPHALGKGSLVIEVQEPTDITLRAERRRPSGELLPETFLHAGRGMDVLLDCFDYRALPEAEARASIFLRPRGGASGEGWRGSVLIDAEVTECFSMRELVLEAGARLERRNEPFSVGLVLEGEGRLAAGGASLRLRRGSEYFLPHGAALCAYEAETRLRMIECGPPGSASLGSILRSGPPGRMES